MYLAIDLKKRRRSNYTSLFEVGVCGELSSLLELLDTLQEPGGVRAVLSMGQ
jgi:hypothetical protein